MICIVVKNSLSVLLLQLIKTFKLDPEDYIEKKFVFMLISNFSNLNKIKFYNCTIFSHIKQPRDHTLGIIYIRISNNETLF